MADTPNPPPDRRVVVAIRVNPSALQVLDRMAADEQRTRSQMARILIGEAIQARQRKR